MGIKENIFAINERIEKACLKAGRRFDDVVLIAVSKAQSTENIIQAIENGITNIGESYIQEFLEKKEKITDKKIHWHFIGKLQSNKVRFLKDNVEFIHSIDTESILKEAQKRLNSGIKYLLEVNMGDEQSKGGLSLKEIDVFLEKMLGSFKLTPSGLMCIPPPQKDPENSRAYFQKLRDLMLRLNKVYNLNMKYLSMGMSTDFDIAIQEGATHIRVGTSLFGERAK